jgi:glutathione S-transferase
MGDTFTVADAYMFTVLRWSPRVGIDLSKWSKHRSLSRPGRRAAQGEGSDAS